MSAEYNSQKASIWMMALGALGVVFGDIGTSPLYAFRECFSEEHGLALTHDNILGVLSLIYWTLFLIICIKYMIFVMRADNKGEGGILSLMALATGSLQPEKFPRRRWALITLGLIGTALLYGDGVITPAISVLSAVEGLKVVTPIFDPFVIPITIGTILILFLLQRFGTGRIGTVFGPILVVWFAVIGLLGLHQIIQYPVVLQGLNPLYAVRFFIENGRTGLLVLGSVILVVTGGEALYADMGHFGREPIRLAWFLFALPALALNYFGQGALLLRSPEAISNPFYMMVPKWGLIWMVVLSTISTVIASQALISGVFSLTKQAVQLGFSPRVPIIHTSSREIGQIYIPFMNWSLLIGVAWLVLSFENSSNLASAYGIAVTGTMLITTILAYAVARMIWHWSVLRSVLVFGGFLIIDIAFFATNAMKIAHGGWVPLAIAAVVYLLMSTWQKGRSILAERLKARSVPMTEFIYNLKQSPPHRVEGSAIYMTGDTWGVPVPLLHNLKHNKVLHSRIAILTIRFREDSTVNKKDRVKIETLGPSFYRIVANYGFMETPKIKHILEPAGKTAFHFQFKKPLLCSAVKPFWQQAIQH